MDGIVIGGCGHGQRHDPDRVGPVLFIPKPMKLPPSVSYSEYHATAKTSGVAFQRQEYKQHMFSSRNDSGGVDRWRVWIPAEIKPSEAMGFLISTAAKAKPENT